MLQGLVLYKMGAQLSVPILVLVLYEMGGQPCVAIPGLVFYEMGGKPCVVVPGLVFYKLVANCALRSMTCFVPTCGQHAIRGLVLHDRWLMWCCDLGACIVQGGKGLAFNCMHTFSELAHY